MLEKADLDRKTKKKDFKKEMDQLEIRLGQIQREARILGIPVIVVFEGWDASGKGTLINNLILPLDPRGFSVVCAHAPNEEESFRPFLWRFWIKIPARGRITIFDRSWYRRVLDERVEEKLSPEQLRRSFEDIRSFERQLSDDGYLIIKFFLHISRKEQKKRLKKLKENNATSWRVTKQDMKRHKQYEEYLAVTESMLSETDTDHARWNVIEAHDERFATLKICHSFAAALENRISEKKRKDNPEPEKKQASIPENLRISILDEIDLSTSIEKEDYKKRLDKNQEKLRELQFRIYRKRIPVVIIYEGQDAAGKGGNIRRLTRELDPRGYEVIPVSAPNEAEKSRNYMWRFWKEIPKAGHIAILDRSWYGRVLVERVEGLCSEEEWKRAYREINEMEQHLLGFGTVLLKFWLQIDREEQLRRFERRKRTPHKRWKITEEDWRNREKWDRYKTAIEEMLFRTSTPNAPWTIIGSNSKHFARIRVTDVVIKAVKDALKS